MAPFKRVQQVGEPICSSLCLSMSMLQSVLVCVLVYVLIHVLVYVYAIVCMLVNVNYVCLCLCASLCDSLCASLNLCCSLCACLYVRNVITNKNSISSVIKTMYSALNCCVENGFESNRTGEGVRWVALAITNVSVGHCSRRDGMGPSE